MQDPFDKLGFMESNGPSSLFTAAKYNNTAVFKHLLQEGENATTSSFDGVTPLMVSLKEGNFDITDLILQSKDNKYILKTLSEDKDREEKNVFHYVLESKNVKKALNVVLSYYKNSEDELAKLLSAKDLNDETPLHKLVQLQYEVNFNEVFSVLSEFGVDILGLMQIGNSAKKTPLHIAAQDGLSNFVIDIFKFVPEKGEEQPDSEEKLKITVLNLLHMKDENSNTPLHLATQHKQTDTTELILDHFGKYSNKPMKSITVKNKFGWSPFSGAVAKGNEDSVIKMLKGLSMANKRSLMEEKDNSNYYPVHLAAKYGHVEVFKVLLRNYADIKRRGPDKKTALDFAIEKEQRSIIRTIINGPMWKESFQMTLEGKDTPLRKLIRELPDLAEEFLDKCCKTEKRHIKNKSVEVEVINMNYEFIEDDKSTHDKDNHPLMIMLNEKKLDLLQHPLCLAIIRGKWSRFRTRYFLHLICYMIFLGIVTSYILSSPSPISNPQLFSCTEFFGNITVSENMTTQEFEVNSHMNVISRYIILVITGLWVTWAYHKWWFKLWGVQWGGKGTTEPSLDRIIQSCSPTQPNPTQLITEIIPNTEFLCDTLVCLLSLYIAAHNFSKISEGNIFFKTDVRTCEQWQVSAVTITIAWLNLLIHMRLLPIVGKYIILFQKVVVTFMKISTVFFVLLTAFALGFFVLLSNKDNFTTPQDAMFKTMIMMAGEFDFGDIFFQDIPPEGWGDQWDRGPQPIPFPGLTYTMFVIFFLLLSTVALNVLVGLTVDGIPNFLQHADLQTLTLLLKIVLEREKGENIDKTNIISKHSHNQWAGIFDLISKEMIWENMRQKEKRRTANLEFENNEQRADRRVEEGWIRQGLEMEKKRRKRKGAEEHREDKKERKNKRRVKREKYERSREGTQSQKETVSQTSLTSNETKSSEEDYEDNYEFFEMVQNVKDIKKYLQVPLTTQEVIAENTQLREKVERLEKKVTDLESIMISITH